MADQILRLTPEVWVVYTKNDNFKLSEEEYGEFLHERNKIKKDTNETFNIAFIKNLGNINETLDIHIVQPNEEVTVSQLQDIFDLAYSSRATLPRFLVELKISNPLDKLNTCKTSIVKANDFHQRLLSKYCNALKNPNTE